MLLVYRKDNNEVVHYVDCDGVNVNPSLFGLYHACLKYNHPELTFQDYGEYCIDEKQIDKDGLYFRDKIIEYSKIFVTISDDKPTGLNFVELGVSDPIVRINNDHESKIIELENTIKQQQFVMDEILKKLNNLEI